MLNNENRDMIRWRKKLEDKESKKKRQTHFSHGVRKQREEGDKERIHIFNDPKYHS